MNNFLNIEKKSSWFFWLFLSAVAIAAWLQFSYSRFSFIDLSINRNEALQIAEKYLSQEKGIDISSYHHAIILRSNTSADRYLQKVLGTEGERNFIKENNFNLFFWKIRFFKEYEQEEYNVEISSKFGEIIAYGHNLKDIEAREFVDEATAQKSAEDFLRLRFGFDPLLYSIYQKSSDKLDNRVQYSFIWQKNSVSIPWKENKNSPPAKLLMSAVVTGDEILFFSKEGLTIPDQFSREINKLQLAGNILYIFFNYFYIFLIVSSIFLVISNRQHLIMRSTKNFYIILFVILFGFQIIDNLLSSQAILLNSPTTSSLFSYLFQVILNTLKQIFLFNLIMIVPGLAGESLRYELYPKKKETSFLHYVRSTFLSREVARLIMLAYLIGIIMIGLQSTLFMLGNKYLGVWTEYSAFPQFSSSYLPFLSGFIVGLQAGLTEEITFRLFTIHCFKKIFKNLFLAAFLASIVWGIGHGTYPVYPMWFRAIEVSILGFFLSFIYLRYGLICTVVAHYLFDVFWGNIAFLIGKSDPLYFSGSMFILLLPLIIAILAAILNRKSDERTLQWKLNKHQLYNLEILKTFINEKIAGKRSGQELKDELISHGWDVIVVEKALDIQPEKF